MMINEHYNRRIRVVGKPGETHGSMLTIRDIETDALIENVCEVEITLGATHKNWAKLIYYKADETTGKLLSDEHREPIEQTITVDNPEIDVTAFEV